MKEFEGEYFFQTRDCHWPLGIIIKTVSQLFKIVEVVIVDNHQDGSLRIVILGK